MLIHNANVTGSMYLNGVDMSTLTGSMSTEIFNQFSSSINEFTSSTDTRLDNLESFSSSLDATFATDTQLTSLSSSVAGRLTTDESNISSLNSKTGSYATTGSNTFTGTQYVNNTTNADGFTSTAALYTDGGLRVSKDAYVSGSMYVNNLTVYGTQSVNYITSSQVLIGGNQIILNTDSPAVRFAGISVYDSGSNQGVTGSLFWDSQNNRWVYANPSGSTYDGGMIISGPRNTSGLGNEAGMTSNRLVKGQGGDHITSSLITDDGTALRVPYTVEVTGSVNATSLTGSLDGSNLTNSSVSNTKLANSSVTVTAGSGLTGGGSVALGSSITLTNAAPDQTVTLTNGGNITVTGTYPNFTLTNGITNNNQLVNGAGYITGINSSDVTTALGYTPVPTTRTLTINGVTYDLSADRTWSIAAGVTSFNTRTGAVTLQASDISGLGAGIVSGSSQISGLTTSNLSATANIANSQLANSSVTVTAGTGLSGGGSVSLGGSITLSNAGIISATAGTGISVSTLSGNVTISNTGLLSGAAGTGISVSTLNQQLTITNTGLLSGAAGTGISVSTLNQQLTITNTGLLSGAAGTGISVSTLNQQLTITNTGLLSAAAGTGISVSTLNQQATITNTGVTSLTAGSGISLSASTGGITVTNTITNNNQLTNGAGYITGLSFDGLSSKTGGTGTYQTSGDFRAPIFYDSNDTTYYLDASSRSQLVQLEVSRGGPYASYRDADLVVGTGTSDRRGYGATGGSSIMLRSSAKSTITALDESQNLGQIAYENLVWTIGEDIGWGAQTIIFPGSARSSTDMRAPIFYDSDNTAYYLNPAGQNIVNQLTVGSTTGTDVSLGVNGNVHITGANYLYQGGSIGSSGGWGTREYASGGTKYINAASFYFDNTGYGGSWYFQVTSGGSAQSNIDMRAPIFYDQNNTGYYVDPAGTSYNNRVDVNTHYNYGWYRNFTNNTGLYNENTTQHLSSATNGYWDVSSTTNASSGVVGIRLYAGGHVNTLRGYFYSDGSGVGLLNNQGGWSVLAYQGSSYGGELRGAWTGTGDLRAPIFYDSNNTGYYLDPSTTGTSLYVAGLLSTTKSSGTYFSANGAGDDTFGFNPSYGTYIGGAQANSRYLYSGNSSYSGPVWYNGSSIQTIWHTGNASRAGNSNLMYYQSFTLDANTMDSNATGFTYSVNAPFTGPIVRISAGGSYDLWLGGNYGGSGTEFYLRTRNGDNATFNPWRRIWTNADSTISAGGDFRAPIFYDSNNTAYYLDPASTSVLNAIRFGTSTNNATLSGNGDWGVRFNNDAGWIQLGPANTGWAHIYSNLNFYMNTHLWVSGGYKVTAWDFNNGSGALYASIFYDANDTGYYLDPNSTSDSALRIRGGALHGPNVTWGKYLLVGGDGRQNRTNDTDVASVCTTNGNLHLDAASGYQTYINWYDGSEFIFGAGDSGTEIMHGYNNYVIANGSFRAPIFYDSNNTGYYIDPASTSNLYAFQSGYFYVNGNGYSTANADQWPYIYWLRDTGAGWDEGLIKASSSRGFFSKAGFGIHMDSSKSFHVFSSGWTANFGVEHGGTAIAAGSFRAPIFYDNNDTSYYVNPNSTTNLYKLVATNGITGGSSSHTIGSNLGATAITWNNSQLELVCTDAGNVGLSFHRAGYTATSFYHTGGSTLYTPGLIEAGGDLRAPIFYDSNNTGYYLDPNSTSRLNVSITNTSYFGTDTNKGYAQGFNTYSTSLHKIGYISFDWDANYNTYSNHGIASTNSDGNFSDNMSINSYNDITLRLDSNANNSTSYVRYMNDTTGANQFAYIGYNGSAYEAYFTGTVYATGDVIAYYSDARLKKDIIKIDSALDKLSKINGYYYKPNEIALSQQNGEKDERKIGVIAQEIQEVFPEVVEFAPFDRDEFGNSKSGEDYLTVKYERLVPVLIAAIKEQQVQIDELKSIINGLTK